METYDDDLSRFEAEGAAPLPVTEDQGYVENDGARIWYAAYGSGAGDPAAWWPGQQRQLGLSGPGAGEERLSRRFDRQPRPRPQHARRAALHYELMASDVLAVMDALHIEKRAWWAGATGRAPRWSSHRKPPRACGRVLFWLQYGPERHKGIRIHTGYRKMLRPAEKDYARAFGHAGPIRRVFRRGRPDAKDAAQLFGARPGPDPRAGR